MIIGICIYSSISIGAYFGLRLAKKKDSEEKVYAVIAAMIVAFFWPIALSARFFQYIFEE